MNGHLHAFRNDLVKVYGKAWPDIFGSHANESVLTFLAAALKTNWVICTKSIIKHISVMDGQSSGFSPLKWVQSGRPTYDHPFIIPSIINRVCTQENWEAGLGYEQYRDIMKCKQDEFDEQGFCKNDRLKKIIKKVLFLQKNEFDYDKINHRYIK